jgi:transcriptional regulator with XRE-family HTH domain
VEKSIGSDHYKVVVATLIELRKQAGLTQRELAARLKREPSFIAKLELGERRIDVLEFVRVCKACKQSPSKITLGLMKRLEKLVRS